ncbi:MAG: EAL domain-containing protein [Oscillospiraceae bacterium]
MKICSKRSIITILIPALLVGGIVACAWLYRSNMLPHIEMQKKRLLYEPGSAQSQLFLSKIGSNFDVLDIYSNRLAEENWRYYPQILKEINASAEKLGFSYVTVVGEDAVLYDKENRASNVSQMKYYKDAAAGQRTFEKTEFDDEVCFVFAVPFTVKGETEGAVVGFCSEETIENLLYSGDAGGDMKSLIFDAAGNLIAGEIPNFKGSENIFTVLDSMASEGAFADAFLRDLKKAVSTGDVSFENASYESADGYYVYHPAGINGWYILNFIPPSFLIEGEQDSPKTHALFGVVVLLSILLAVTNTVILWRRRVELNREQRKSHEAYFVDPLTSLYNKQGFESKIRKRLLKLPEERVCALVSFEVVAFRSYNALYGFEAGDELLKTIAGIVRKFLKEDDVAGRLYADHFVWFINRETKEEIFETFRSAVRVAKDSKLPFFLCGGIYIIEDRDESIRKMIDNASIAKDTIKYKFSTGIAIYDDSMLECQLEDAELIGSMMRGLENGEFVDYYQPKYNMSNESITGAEVLVRWKKPDGEIIMPGRFIELFEKNGFIRKLDFYIFEKACSILHDAQEKNIPVVPISVNFSRVHLYDSRFPQRIYDLAQKYDVDTKYLEIELTESAFLMEGEVLHQVVDKLHEYGFSVAIDDFGSGFSSLNMLKDVEVDTLKIDMKFLDGFERGGKVGTVVTSVIRMAKWLGIPVVAEGVETKDQIDFLRTLGCDMVQGYYYSRPVTREDYEKLIISKDSVCMITDKPPAVTLDSINAVMGGDSLVTSLVDGILGGFGLYELSEGRMEAIRVNRAYCEMLGYPDMAAFSIHSLNVLTQVYPPDIDGFLEACNKAISTGNVQKFTARRYNYYGKLMQFKGFIKHIGGTETRPLICLTFLDATERIRAEKERELNKYSNALYGIFDEIFEFNYMANTFRTLSANRKRCYGNILNLNKVEKSWLENKIYPDDREMIEKIIISARSDMLELPVTVEYRVVADGEVRWIMSSMVKVSGGSYLLCNLDITQKKQFEMFVEKMENLHQRAEFDMATGMLNKTTAETLIAERLKKHKTDKKSALLLISLDDLKLIEDTFGALTGEAFLKDAASRIKSLFREQDIIGRIDDEKFVVFISEISSPHIAYSKAVKVQDYVSDIVLPDMHIVNCSVGINIISQHNKNYAEVFQRAEKALSEARESSAARCVMYDEKDEKTE